MKTLAGKMISVEVGVRQKRAARRVRAALMKRPAPHDGDERPIAEHTRLTFLRTFDVSGTSAPNEPSVWVDFAIRIDMPAKPDPIARWLTGALGDLGDEIALRVNKIDVALNEEEVREVL